MFSAGGPGKGMYSRLYTVINMNSFHITQDVMNKYGWFESCNIQEYFHRNQGIICLQGILNMRA